MADNYLENKYEKLQQGRPVIRKVNPSLDSLLKAISSKPESIDSEYRISSLQTDAALASARRLDIPFSAMQTGSDPHRLEVICRNEYDLGTVTAAIRLKLAELNLHSEVQLEKTRTAAVLTIYRPGKK